MSNMKKEITDLLDQYYALKDYQYDCEKDYIDCHVFHTVEEYEVFLAKNKEIQDYNSDIRALKLTHEYKLKEIAYRLSDLLPASSWIMINYNGCDQYFGVKRKKVKETYFYKIITTTKDNLYPYDTDEEDELIECECI